jgi:signal transduction histidine kinase
LKKIYLLSDEFLIGWHAALRIKTKVLVGTIVSSILVTGICVLLIATTIHVRNHNRDTHLAINLTESVLNLDSSVLSFANKPNIDTYAKLAPATESITKGLNQLKGRFGSPEQKALINKIRDENVSVKKTIPDLYSGNSGSTESVAPVTEPQMQVIHSILRKSDEMLAATDSIRAIIVSELVSAEDIEAVISISFLAVVIVILVGTSLLVIRSVTTPLRELENGTRTIAEGNYDFQLAVKRNDEIGEVARSFNKMATQLRDSFAALGREISERKRAEQSLRETNDELEGFAHTVSHDIKGPIASIGVAAQTLNVLLTGPATEESSQQVENIVQTINANIEKTGNLIDDILSLAEAGQVPARTTDVDVRQIVETILEENAWIAERKRIRFEISDDLGIIRANPTQIYQIFSNLISNAIKYNDSTEPLIEVSFLGKDEEGGHRYLVRDNSSGIPSDELEKIFIPFFKGRRGTTGIGLATVGKMVEIYSGSIEAYNQNGACFEFVIKDLVDGPRPEGPIKAKL